MRFRERTLCLFFVIFMVISTISAKEIKSAHDLSNDDVDGGRFRRDADTLDVVFELAKAIEHVLGLPPIVDVIESIAKLFVVTKPSLWEQIENDVRTEVRTAITHFHEANLLGILRYYRERLEGFVLRAMTYSRLERSNRSSSPSWRKDFIDDVYNHYAISIRGRAHLFEPSNFERVLIYDVSLFHIYFSFLSHESVILKLLENQCARLDPPVADSKYQPSFYAEKLDALKKEIKNSALPDAKLTAKRLFWGDLNFKCQRVSYQRVRCENAWSGDETTFFWDVRLPIVDVTSPRTWNLYFADSDLAADGNVASCSGQSFFDYADGSFVDPGAYDECGRVAWTASGECRKISEHPAKYVESGTLCGVNPRRVYLKAARDFWRNFTAPTMLMFGEKVSIEGKNVTASGLPCLDWNSIPDDDGEKANWTGFTNNLCANPDDWVNGPWCFASETERRECYDTSLPDELFPEGCLSPSRKYGKGYDWCIQARSKNYPYGGSWKTNAAEPKVTKRG